VGGREESELFGKSAVILVVTADLPVYLAQLGNLEFSAPMAPDECFVDLRKLETKIDITVLFQSSITADICARHDDSSIH